MATAGVPCLASGQVEVRDVSSICHSIGDRSVNSTGELRNLVAAAGAKVRTVFTIWREGKERQVGVELGEAPMDASEPHGREGTGLSHGTVDGLSVEDLTPVNRKRFGISDRVERGVVITAVAPGSRASRAGLSAGDVVVEANRNPVTTAEQFQKAWRQAKGTLLLLIDRDGWTRYVVIRKG